jgi:hypothetical protein
MGSAQTSSVSDYLAAKLDFHGMWQQNLNMVTEWMSHPT